jgi:type 1 glutamine amidotransferase
VVILRPGTAHLREVARASRMEGVEQPPVRRVATALATVLLAGCAGPAAAPAPPAPAASTPPAPAASGDALTSVLVFTRTTGFRHASIPDGVAAIQRLGAEHGFAVTATEDPGAFTADGLAPHQAVVWLSTTGDVLDAAQQAAFQRYVEGGGGFVGIHAAADTEYDWPWYGELVGAWFRRHPAVQEATVRVEDRAHPSTGHLSDPWVRSDEWYDFRGNPRPAVRVLLSLDEASYTGGSMGDHPITWCHDVGAGRSWYTGVGHTEESFADPDVTRLLLGGIRWAAGAG